MDDSIITYTEDDLLASIRSLTRPRLHAWLHEGLVRPQRVKGEAWYDDIDRARLELICLLTEEFEVNDDALAVFVGYLDQVHGLRRQLAALLRAVGAQPDHVRLAIIEACRKAG